MTATIFTLFTLLPTRAAKEKSDSSNINLESANNNSSGGSKSESTGMGSPVSQQQQRWFYPTFY